MKVQTDSYEFFGKEKIWKILLRIAPPVMFAMLIQAMYNIVDSYFIGKFSEDGLTALSVVYPLQLLITALAVGTGVGVNTYMASLYARDRDADAEKTAGAGMLAAIVMWVIIAILSALFMPQYTATSTRSQQVIEYGSIYGMIVGCGSLGVFLEGIWTKVHQARGNMRRPMIAQVAGAVTNIVLDPLLIFGVWIIPPMGIAGAAIATIVGQFVAAIIVAPGAIRKIPAFSALRHCIRRIIRLGFPSIFMQSLYVVYIFLLNVILSGFCDSATVVLGLYYKAQAFFFIPLFGLQTCIVPVLSYNFTRQEYSRCRRIFGESLLISAVFMLAAIACFEFIPKQLLAIFSKSEEVYTIGITAFRIIGSSFFPAVFSLMFPVFFQAIGKGVQSVSLSLIRQIICLVPAFYLFSLIGLNYAWIGFPLAETITTVIGFVLYFRQTNRWKEETKRLQRISENQ